MFLSVARHSLRLVFFGSARMSFAIGKILSLTYLHVFQWYLTELNEHFMVEIPKSARVYPTRHHAIAILIVVMYVDNNGLSTNAKELVQWFDDSLKRQGEIEMVPEGKFEWFLGVWSTCNHSTGSVMTDQESTIDRLLKKYGLTNCNPAKVSMRPDTDLARLPISPLQRRRQ